MCIYFSTTRNVSYLTMFFLFLYLNNSYLISIILISLLYLYSIANVRITILTTFLVRGLFLCDLLFFPINCILINKVKLILTIKLKSNGAIMKFRFIHI